jgi:predicted PurR-regulated permease PerM
MIRELTANPLAQRVLLGMFVGLLGLSVSIVLAPFVIPMLWAGILAFSTWPLYLYLLNKTGQRSTVAALLLTLLMSALVVFPVIWLVFLLRAESSPLIDLLTSELASGRVKPPVFISHLPIVGAELSASLGALLAEPARISLELKNQLRQLDAYAFAALGGIGKNIIKLLLALFTLFFVYLHGANVAKQVRTICISLLGERADGYLKTVALTTRAVVYGIVLTALIQGAVAGLGYWAAGLSAPVTLAAVTVLLAMVPFGTPVVWGAAGLWLLFTGQTAAGIGLLLWGVMVVSWVDNIVRPLVLSEVVDIPFILALFGVLGGLAAFGLVGLFLGPVILAVALAVWREWLDEEVASAKPPQ